MQSRKTSIILLRAACAVCLFFGFQNIQATILYVKANATGANNGTSWTNAYPSLQTALLSANVFDDIWVAAGTYKPSSFSNRSVSFVLKNRVSIYGGFPGLAGQEGNFGVRDWVANVTILSGDLSTFYHSYHVITSQNIGNETNLNGLTITGGDSDGSGDTNNVGGGMYNDHASPTIEHCIFSNNSAISGGGMYNNMSSPRLIHCTFSENSATFSGGGIYNYIASPVFIDCVFSENTAQANGGAMRNNNANPIITRCTFLDNVAGNGGGLNNQYGNTVLTACTFSGNLANSSGGGIMSAESSLTLKNCTFSGNSATYRGGGLTNSNTNSSLTNCVFSGNACDDTGGGIAYESCNTSILVNCTFSGNAANVGAAMHNNLCEYVAIANCIFWGNGSGITNVSTTPVITYSIVQGGYPGDGNLNVDPLFVDQPPVGLGTSGNVRLQPCSPAKDKGTIVLLPGASLDIDGDARPHGAGTDMGFDENTVPCCPDNGVLYVKAGATGSNTGVSWADAFTDLQSALNSTCTGITQIWVAAGTYKPTTGADPRISFALKNGIALYGGFPDSGNPGFDDRDYMAYATTLSGEIGLPGPADNSFHVISNTDLNHTAVLDGFYITKGGSTDLTNHSLDYSGGGMRNYSASPTITNCIFTGNAADTGSGMANFISSSPVVTNCTFSGNTAVFGPAMSNSVGCNPIVTNCLFLGNTASVYGAVLYNNLSTPNFTNCTFSGNAAAPYSGIMFNQDSYANLTNCIVWGNSYGIVGDGSIIAAYSIIERPTGVHPGTGNLNVNPLFVSQPPFGLGTTGNVHLQTCSPAIDRGIDAANLTTTTLDGNIRKFEAIPGGSQIDMGAWEYQQTIAAPVITCQNQTILLDSFGNTSLGISSLYNSSLGCSLTYTPALNTILDYNCNNLGANTVTLTATDVYGRTANCQSTITVKDEIAPVVSCPPSTAVVNTNGGYSCSIVIPNYQFSIEATDNCSVRESQSYVPGFYVDVPNGTVIVVNYYATDNATPPNTTTCTITITIHDNDAPMITCPESQTAVPANPVTCSAVVNDLDASASDNCSGVSVGYILTGATTGSNSGLANGLNFNSGLTTVTYTATDGAGNTASCAFSVTVSPCIHGKIIWKQDNTSGVKDVAVAVTGDQTSSAITGANGLYDFILSGSNFTITPSKNTNKLNGVNASDVFRIQQHLSGNLITDPWQLIAADANSNGVVNSLDLSIIQQSILGNPQAQAQMIKSWRFVPVSYGMTNPPWGFPENIVLSGASGNQTNRNFYGIKVGDVVAAYANPANAAPAAAFVLTTSDKFLQAGDTLQVEFRAAQTDDLAALQLGLHFDANHLQLIDLQPLTALPLSNDNFSIAGDHINFLWAGEQGADVPEAAPIFRLTFNVLKSGSTLREVLSLREDGIIARAYKSNLAESPVLLHYVGVSGATHPGIDAPLLLLLQNQPNPFATITEIGFELPDACTAQLRIFDAGGRLIVSRSQQYTAGTHSEAFDLEGVSGVLYYELSTPFGVLSKKMVAF